MKHPDNASVQSILKSVMTKRRYIGWKIEKLGYVHFPSRYDILFSNGKEQKSISVVTEFFDEISKNDSPISRRRLRQQIKAGLFPDDKTEDND